MWLVISAKQNKCADEESAGSGCKQEDGVAVGSLSGGRRGHGVVLALGAALRRGCSWSKRKSREQ